MRWLRWCWPRQSRSTLPIEDALNELGKALHKQKMPAEVVQQVYTGKLKPDVLTLAMRPTGTL